MSASQDMTTGSPGKLMTRFALPLMGSYLFQQLYTLADGLVVGRLVGVEALAAVGATAFLSWMVLSLVLGFTQGFGVFFAQRFGAKDEAGLRRAATTSLWLCGAIGLGLTALGIGLAPAVLRAVNTPVELMEDALAYLNWIIGGTCIAVGYNLAGALLRAFGDSKTPLVAVVLSGVLNVALDVVLVGLFHWGVAGAAIATVVSQLLSLAYCLWALRGQREQLFSRREPRPDRATAATLLRLGAPMAFRNGVISVGGLFVQNAINQYGALFVAGMAAAKRYYGVMEVVSAGLEGAVATFVGQNAGRGDVSRIKAGMAFARRTGLLASGGVLALVFLLARPLVGLLISSPDPLQQALALEAGVNALRAMALCMPALYMLCMHRAAIQGMGHTLVPMFSGFMELALRILCVLSAASWLGVGGVYFADGIGWIGAMALVCLAYPLARRGFEGRLKAQGLSPSPCPLDAREMP
ncbi:MAG: MATE family efflux transporter [Candidatus Limiplasma sp.]|nr:MATE family efflux transporter [Candidatus Limiplasma sp.]